VVVDKDAVGGCKKKLKVAYFDAILLTIEKNNSIHI